MVNSFKRFASRGVVSPTQVGSYAVPSGVQAVMFGMTIANMHSSSIRATIDLRNSSGTVSTIAQNAPIDPGGSLIIDVKVAMGPGDRIFVTSSNNCDVLMSVLEIS